MEGWFQLDWFGGDWNASNWDGPEGSTNGVTFSKPSIAATGTVGSSAITGSGTATIAAPDITSSGYHRHRGGKVRRRVDDRLEFLLAQEDESILSAIRAFVQLEDEEWDVPLQIA